MTYLVCERGWCADSFARSPARSLIVITVAPSATAVGVSWRDPIRSRRERRLKDLDSRPVEGGEVHNPAVSYGYRRGVRHVPTDACFRSCRVDVDPPESRQGGVAILQRSVKLTLIG